MTVLPHSRWATAQDYQRERGFSESAEGLALGLTLGLALALPLVIEAGKWIRRRRAPEPAALDVEQAVAPARAAKTTA